MPTSTDYKADKKNNLINREQWKLAIIFAPTLYFLKRVQKIV